MAFGYVDPNGVWFFGEDDSGGNAADLWNKGQLAQSNKFQAVDLRLANLEAPSPAWAPWVPALTGITLGNGVLNGYRRDDGKSVDFRLELTIGTTTVIGANPGFTLPAGRRHVNVPMDVGSAIYYDTSVPTRRFGSAANLPSASNTALLYLSDGTSISATVPWTWVGGDFICVLGRYERT